VPHGKEQTTIEPDMDQRAPRGRHARAFRFCALEGLGLSKSAGGTLILVSQITQCAASQPGGGGALTLSGIALLVFGAALARRQSRRPQKDFRAGGFLTGLFAGAALTLGAVALTSKEPPPPPDPSCAPAPSNDLRPTLRAVPEGRRICPFPKPGAAQR
jgi:hypothetical protein